MIQSLLIAIGFMVAIVLAWTLVQHLWRDTFREEYTQEDVLAGRRSCANCGCTGICEREEGSKTAPEGETTHEIVEEYTDNVESQ